MYIYTHVTIKGYLCCSIADQKGVQNPALRRKTTSMEQINPHIRVSWRPASNWEILPPILWNSVTDFEEINHRLWANKPSTFGKSATNFGENNPATNFWGNPSPTLGKSVADFREICHRFWGNPSPILRKSVIDYEEIRNRF